MAHAKALGCCDGGVFVSNATGLGHYTTTRLCDLAGVNVTLVVAPINVGVLCQLIYPCLARCA